MTRFELKALAAAVAATTVIAIAWDYFRDKSSRDKENLAERAQTLKRIEIQQYELARQIQKSAGNNLCKEDMECRIVGLGPKTCGGYRDFLFYSLREADLDMLNATVTKFNENQTKLNDLLLAANKCGKPIPEVRCISGKCTAIEN